MLDPAARAAGHRMAGLSVLQILLCSSAPLPSTHVLIHALDSTSLPSNRSTFTTEILQRKPARFQRGLNLEKFASSTAFVLFPPASTQIPNRRHPHGWTNNTARHPQVLLCLQRLGDSACMSPAPAFHNLRRELFSETSTDRGI